MAGKHTDWNLYRTFLEVVRKGSLSAAARELGCAQPTVGRQVESLESALGTKLFTRSQTGLLPTQSAMELVAHAQAMATAVEALQRASSGGVADETGAVRLTVGSQIGIEVLPQMLTKFSRRYPRIELELSISSRTEDLLHRDADIAIRLSRPMQQSLVVRRVGKILIGLYAHRSYLELYGMPRTTSDLSRHRLIGFDRDIHLLRSFGGIAAHLQREDFSFRTDSVAAQLGLLRAGIGIGACHAHVARAAPELRPVLRQQISFEKEVWLVMHGDLKGFRRVRILFDYLQREMNRYLALVS